MKKIDFEKNVDLFMEEYCGNKYSRYRSYDFCRKVFNSKQGKTDQQTLDELALNLYAFLGSWGMACRGKIFMQNNYKILVPVVEIIMNYYDLQDVDIFSATFDAQAYVSRIVELKGKIEAVLFVHFEQTNRDTVLGKILLGALGCVPAYDTHIVKKLRSLGYCGSFSKTGLKSLLKFAEDYKDTIQGVIKKYENKTMVTYSAMKYIDSALWIME